MTTPTGNIPKIYQITLVIISIGLTVFLFLELNRDYSKSYNMATNSDNEEAMPLSNADKEFPPITEYQAIVDRPLFMESRQPFVYQEPEEEPEQTTVKKRTTPRHPTEQFLLTGTIITEEKSIAILRAARGKESKHLVLGGDDTFDDWVLTEVNAEEVVLKRGEETQTLKLEMEQSPRKPTQRQRIGRRTSERSSAKANRKTAPADNDTEEDSGPGPENKPEPADTE